MSGFSAGSQPEDVVRVQQDAPGLEASAGSGKATIENG
jgi:hypothetical protein